MKIAVIFFTFLFISVNCSSDETLKCNRFLVDAVIRQLFELLRQLIKTGSIANNVPVVDPFQKEYQDVVLENDKFRIKAELFNFKLSGLGDFELLDTTFDRNDISLELNLQFPLISIVSDQYNMSGDVFGILPLFGSGLLHIEAHNLVLNGKIYLKQSSDGKSILIKKLLRTRFEVDKILSQTQFDDNIDDILNAMVEDLLADYLTRFSKFIAAQHEQYATQFLNQYISNFESWRLIAAIL